MKKRFGTAICLLALAMVGATGAARAADYAERPRVAVTVDELFLRAGGCPRNPNCIAPRVLPITGRDARGEGLATITVPAPPQPAAAFSFFGFP